MGPGRSAAWRAPRRTERMRRCPRSRAPGSRPSSRRGASARRLRFALAPSCSRPREEHPARASRRRGVEEVALVLARVDARVEEAVLRPRVVPRRDELGAELVRDVEELQKLHGAVARRAGARRLAAHVRLDEGLHHVPREERAAVEREVRKPHLVGHPPRVVLVLRRAAPTMRAQTRLRIVPKVQRAPHDVVSGVEKARRRDGGIDPAAHRHENTRLFHFTGPVENTTQLLSSLAD